jgi:FKBP-type peptidyl-prolyl cis-trans isomerase 2
MKITKGNKVTLEYEGKLDNGDIFDSSKGREPLSFIAGHKQVIAGFDEAVMGMKVGEEKEFHIDSKNAYGEPKKELMREIPKAAIKADQEMKPGMIIAMATPDGHQIPLLIKEVKKDTIILDMNHPLAGKNLNFKIKILEIKEGGDDEPCSCDGNHDCDCDEEDECGCEDCAHH